MCGCKVVYTVVIARTFTLQYPAIKLDQNDIVASVILD